MGRVKGGNAEEFWIRYEEIRPSQKDLPLIIKTGIKQSTLSTYKTKQRFPRADEAVKIAQALGTTVEYLVDGEEGAEYIRAIIAREGRLWRPPPRIEAVVRVLESLDEEKLDTVKTMIGALSGEGGSIQKVQGS